MAKSLRDRVTSALSKKFGDDLFDNIHKPADYISTGIPSFDHLLSRPGLACGRVTAIVGQYSSGKSGLLHSTMAECQRRGGLAVLLETEDALDERFMRVLGVDTDALVKLRPTSIEAGIAEIKETVAIVRAESPDELVLIGWDSIAASPIEKELDEKTDGTTMGGHARLLSQFFRQHLGTISSNRICFVIVNQIKEKIGGLSFMDNDVMLADKPIRFASSTIIKVSRTKKLLDEKGRTGNPIGIAMQAEVIKHKLGPPFRRTAVNLFFDSGFDLGQSWLALALEVGVVKQQSKGWLVFPDGAKCQKQDAQRRIRGDTALQELVQAAATASYAEVTDYSVDDDDTEDPPLVLAG